MKCLATSQFLFLHIESTTFIGFSEEKIEILVASLYILKINKRLESDWGSVFVCEQNGTSQSFQTYTVRVKRGPYFSTFTGQTTGASITFCKVCNVSLKVLFTCHRRQANQQNYYRGYRFERLKYFEEICL